MDLGLQDKRAIVTGGSRGIGKAIARELAREGVNVERRAKGLRRWCGTRRGWLVKDTLGPFSRCCHAAG